MPAKIAKANAALDALYHRRALLFQVLMRSGHKQAAVARIAGVTPQAVAFAVERFPWAG